MYSSLPIYCLLLETGCTSGFRNELSGRWQLHSLTTCVGIHQHALGAFSEQQCQVTVRNGWNCSYAGDWKEITGLPVRPLLASQFCSNLLKEHFGPLAYLRASSRGQSCVKGVISCAYLKITFSPHQVRGPICFYNTRYQLSVYMIFY